MVERLAEQQRILKVENIAVTSRSAGTSRGDFREFVRTLRDMKKGQSFMWRLSSNDRMAISIVQILFDREFVSRREGDAFRVGRVR